MKNIYDYMLYSMGIPTLETFNNLLSKFPPVLELEEDLELALDDFCVDYFDSYYSESDGNKIIFSNYGIERLFYAFFLYTTYLDVDAINLEKKIVRLMIHDSFYDGDNKYSLIIEDLNKVNNHISKYGWIITNYEDLLND